MLDARQRPGVDPRRQDEPPPQILGVEDVIAALRTTSAQVSSACVAFRLRRKPYEHGWNSVSKIAERYLRSVARGCRPFGWRLRDASRRRAGSNISPTLTGEHVASPTAAAPANGHCPGPTAPLGRYIVNVVQTNVCSWLTTPSMAARCWWNISPFVSFMWRPLVAGEFPSYLHGHSAFSGASSRHSGGEGGHGRTRLNPAHGSARLLGRPRDPLLRGRRLQTRGPAGPGGRKAVSTPWSRGRVD